MNMHKVLAGIALCMLAACAPTGRIEMPEPKHIPLEKGLALFEAFNRHDWTQMAGLYSPDAVFLDPALGQHPVVQSHDSIVSKYTALASIIPDIQDSVAYIVPCDTNKLLVEFVSKGTMPDGNPFRLPIVSVLTFSKGLIVADHTYYDNSGGE